MSVPKSNVTIFLDADLLERVKVEAETDGRSVSNCVEQILRKRFQLPSPGMLAQLHEANRGIAGQRQVDIEEQIAATKPQRKSRAKRK